jgi:hypothetical protein
MLIVPPKAPDKKPDDGRAATALSALCRALHETNKVAVARVKLRYGDSAPRMWALLPRRADCVCWACWALPVCILTASYV